MADRQDNRGLLLGAAVLGLLLLRPAPRTPPTEPGEGVDIDELLRTVEELKQLLDQAERQLEDLRRRLQDAMGALDRINEDVRRLEDYLSQLQNRRDELLRQIDEAEATVAALESSVNALDEELAQIASETGMTEEQLRALRGYVNQQRALIDQLEAQLQQMRATLQQMQQTIDALRATIDQLKADIASLKAALDAANALIAELQKTIESLRATVAKLENQVNKLKLVLDWLNYELQVRDQDLPVISAHFQSVYAPGVYYMPPRQPTWNAASVEDPPRLPAELTAVLAQGLHVNKPYTYRHGNLSVVGSIWCRETYLCCDGLFCTRCHTDYGTVKAWLEVVDASGNVLSKSSEITGNASRVHPGGYVTNQAFPDTGTRELSIEMPAGANLTLRLRARLEGWAYIYGPDHSSLTMRHGSKALAPLYYRSDLSFYGSSLAALEQRAGAVAGRLLQVKDAPADPELSVKARVARVVAVNGIQAGVMVLPFSQEARLSWNGKGESIPNAWPYAGWFLFGTDGSRVLFYGHAEKDLPAHSPTFSGETTLRLPSGAYVLVAFAGTCPGGLQCQGVGSMMEVSVSYGFYGGLARE